MEKQNLLPVGSVVLLRDANKELMIIGILPTNGDTQYDYLAVMYPEGYISEKYVFLCNHSDIAEIKFIGYMNADFQVFRAGLKTMLDELEAK